jgi:hypothetical protein
MVAALDFADGLRFQQPASKFVSEPSQKRINVFAACLKPEYLGVVIDKVARVGLFTVLGKAEDIHVVPDLFSDTPPDVTQSVSDVTQELIAKVLARVGHSIPR